MAKLSLNDISNMQFDKEKVFVVSTQKELVSARSILTHWKCCNPGFDFKTKSEKQEGVILLYVTKLNHPRSKNE